MRRKCNSYLVAGLVFAAAAFWCCEQREKNDIKKSEAAECDATLLSPSIDSAKEQPVVPEEQNSSETQDGKQEAWPENVPAQQMTREGERTIFRAIGRVKRGKDIALDRDVAAARAREQLLNLLKKKGYLPQERNEMTGSTIERYFIRGRYLYAVAMVEIEKDLNHSEGNTSIKTEGSNGGTP